MSSEAQRLGEQIKTQVSAFALVSAREGVDCYAMQSLLRSEFLRDVDRLVSLAQQADGGTAGAWQTAALDARDAILNGRGPLEAVLDGDQTNAVLGAFDNAFGHLLASQGAEGRQPLSEAAAKRATEMLTAYKELIKATGKYAEEFYVPEIEYVIEKVSESATGGKSHE